MTNEAVYRFFEKYGIAAVVGFIAVLLLLSFGSRALGRVILATKTQCVMDMQLGDTVDLPDGKYRVARADSYIGIGEISIELRKQ